VKIISISLSVFTEIGKGLLKLAAIAHPAKSRLQ
jgi:hypothetical protein